MSKETGGQAWRSKEPFHHNGGAEARPEGESKNSEKSEATFCTESLL